MADTYTNGKVAKPIVLTKVANTIGFSTNDVGRLCGDENNHVNKWSKHKPVRNAALFPEYNEAFFRQMTSHEGSIITIYGMQVAQGTEQNHIDAYDLYNGEGQWEYLKPEGMAKGSPYRLGDFDGYFHNAQPLCASQIIKDNVMNIRLGVTQSTTDTLRFFVDGASGSLGGIRFSDIAEGGDSKLVLCANIFSERDDYQSSIEIINNNIRLNTSGQPSSLNADYDDGADRYKYVDVQLVPDFDGAGHSYHVWVVLTLDYVKYIGGQWKSTRKIVIPHDDNHYYLQDIKLERLVNSFQVQAQDIRYGDNGYEGLWHSIYLGAPYARISSPLIRFEVTHILDALTFLGTDAVPNGYKIKCKGGNSNPNGVMGLLKDRQGNNLGKQEIPKGDGIHYVTTNVYYEFPNLFPEGENYYRQQGGWCRSDIYLVYPTGKEELIGNLSLQII